MSFLTHTSLSHIDKIFKRTFTTTRSLAMQLRNTTVNRIEIPSELKIELTEVEGKLCVLFDECTKHLREMQGVSTSCRLAGGWVRDKLLGAQSNDIDIALTDIMGVPFAEHFVAFAHGKGVETGRIAKIEMNPDQSKHLETARFSIFGLDVDLVNLRCETYAEHSRIPNEVAFGTPVQDALRRDITINALFYNIHTRAVEDCTERGLEDLRKGIIRTPLPPAETFQDDPLRIIRCIRFASRFGFNMVPELEDCVKEPAIQEALSLKVARERIGEELTKMMKGRNPLHSLQLINDLSLYHSIFSIIPPSITLSSQPSPSITSLAAASILQALINPDFVRHSQLPAVHPILLSAVTADPSCKARLFLSAALTPYSGITYVDRKGNNFPAMEVILRESLKLGTQNHFLDGIPMLFAAAKLLRNPSLSNERFKKPTERVAIGLLLRNKVVHNVNTGSHWTSSLLFSLVQELVPLYDVASDQLNVEAASEIIGIYNTFVNRVEELNLTDAGDAKPILNGREVVEVLGATNSGPWTGQILSKVMEWQLQHPEGTKDDCSLWLKSERDSGSVHIESEGTSTSKRASKKLKTKR